MSYDIYLKRPKCESCGHIDNGPDLPNPTYNLTPIFDLALTNEQYPNPEISEFSTVILGEKTERPRGLRVLNGRTGKETRRQLENAVEQLANTFRAEEFRKIEPENGWGTLREAWLVMIQLHKASEVYPDHVWEIH